MNIAASRNMGAFIKQVLGLAPLSNADGVRNGAAIDRSGYHSCSLAAIVGASSGAPTSFTIDYKIQDSADGSTGWADYVDSGTVQATANGSMNELDIDLSAAKSFIRVVETVTHVGGTSPETVAGVSVALGGADLLPAA